MTATKRKTTTCNGRKGTPEVHTSDNSSSSSSIEDHHQSPPPINLTIAKKTNKPLMEKRRRARINESLNLLKDLVVKESDNPAKLEKADILELTVKRVREINSSQSQQSQTTTVQDSFRLGFDKCLEATTDFLHFSGLGDLSHRLANHLRSRIPLLESSTLSPPLSSIGPNSPSLSIDSSYIDEIEPINLALPYRNSTYSAMWRPW